MATTAAAAARACTIGQYHHDEDMKRAMSAAARVVSIPHLSFATDLLFNFDAVRAHNAQGATTQQSLMQLLKSRIALERMYANELSKMAQQSQVDELEHGSLRLALGSLRAQYVNSSVQHRALANSLEEDVLKPIENMYTRQNQNVQNLLKRVNTIKKKAKACEDVYKKDYNTFDKQFREASVTFAAAMDAGFSSTLIDIQYRKRLSQIQEEPNIIISAAEADGRIVQKSAVAIQALNNNSQKLVNWLLSSDQGKKENLCSNTVHMLEAAELSRRRCQQSWQQVEQSRIDVYRDLQSILTEYQDMAEQRTTKIATSLRKHVVFESSALANEQYDWQMIAGRIENVDNEGDIRDFILSHRLHDLPSMTVNDLCCAFEGGMIVTSPNSKPSRPLKKCMLEISDLAARKIPFDHRGNQSLLSRLLVIRKQSIPARADIYSVEKARNGTYLSQSDENKVRYDELTIVCKEDTPSTSSSTSPCSIKESSQRICFAKDVAQAINKAHAVHAEQKSVSLGKAIFPADRTEPEDNGVETSLNSIELRPATEPSSCLQSNDVEEDEGFGDRASENDSGVI